MDLLEAILALTKNSEGRNLQRQTLYKAVTRVVERLTQSLRQGDIVMYRGRQYFLVDQKGERRYLAVNTGSGAGYASLGIRFREIPFASYEEHVFFSEQVARIVEMFADLIRRDVKRMQSAERELLDITEGKLNAS